MESAINRKPNAPKLPSEVAAIICEALGLDPNTITRLVIDIQPGEYPKVYIASHTGDLPKLDWPALASLLKVEKPKTD